MELLQDPLHISSHTGVNPIQSLTPTILWGTPRDKTKNHPPPAKSVFHYKCPTTVSLAGVLTTFEVPRTEHVVSNVVSGWTWCVARLTLLLRHHRQLDILQGVRGYPKVQRKRCGAAESCKRWDVKAGDPPTCNYTQRVWQRSLQVFLDHTKLEWESVSQLYGCPSPALKHLWGVLLNYTGFPGIGK